MKSPAISGSKLVHVNAICKICTNDDEVSDSMIARRPFLFLFPMCAHIISFIFIAHYSFMVLRVHSRT